MPDILTHAQFARDVYRGLRPSFREGVDLPLFELSSAGPDLWFSYRFWNPAGQKGKPHRGTVMQHEKTGEFLQALAEAARVSKAGDLLYSYLYGFLCHYCLDRATHPYIIYRSGEYDGTEQTRSARGGHMALEHGIDRMVLAQWGKTFWQRPITRIVLRLHKLPLEMREDLNRVYQSVYGWQDVWSDWNRGIRDQRLFYHLVQDPLGILDWVLHRLDRGTSQQDLRVLSYYGKDQPGLDLTNDAHVPWHHPQDEALTFREGFWDLYRIAQQEAIGMIEAVRSDLPREELARRIGDASYETGFPWQDARNAAIPICQPLPLNRMRIRSERSKSGKRRGTQ